MAEVDTSGGNMQESSTGRELVRKPRSIVNCDHSQRKPQGWLCVNTGWYELEGMEVEVRDTCATTDRHIIG